MYTMENTQAPLSSCFTDMHALVATISTYSHFTYLAVLSCLICAVSDLIF